MRLSELRAEKARLVDEFATMLDAIEGESRAASEEEAARLAEIRMSTDALTERIGRTEWLQAERAGMAAPVHAGGMPSAHALRHAGRLKAFQGPTAREDAFKAGQWILACFFGNARAAEFCRSNGVPIERAGGQVEGQNVYGGFVVPVEMVNAIIDLREAYGVFRREVRVYPMSSDTAVVPRRVKGLKAYPIGEGQAIPPSKKEWARVQLVARKWGILGKVSSELSEDAALSIADDLADEMAYAFAFSEDEAGFKGDGSGDYHGIVGIVPKITDGSHSAGVIPAAAGHNTFEQIDQADLSRVQAALPNYVLTPRWYVSRSGFELMFGRLASVAGGNTMDNLAERPQLQYNGYPVVISQTLERSSGTLPAGTVMALFGNMVLSTLMGDRRSITIATSEHVYFEEDELGMRGTERIDIVNHSLGDTQEAGPVVALTAA